MQMSRANFLLVCLLIITFFLGIIIPKTDAIVRHSIPRGGLKKRQLPPRPRHAGGRRTKPYVPILNWEQQIFVKVHNDLRGTLGMPPMSWDPKLASHAHSWAAQRKGDCNYRQHSKGPYGENTFWMQYKEFSPADVVKGWFQEKSLFDHGRNVCRCQPERDGCECGHYVNVVWKTTKRVGCSSPVYCKHGKGLLVVCSYDPPGGFLGVNPLIPPLRE